MADNKTSRLFSGENDAPAPSGEASDRRVLGGGRDSAAAAALQVGASSHDDSAACVSVPSEPRRRNARMQRIGIGIVAAFSAILIGVSAFALAGGSPAEKQASEPEFSAVEQPASSDGGEAVAQDETEQAAEEQEKAADVRSDQASDAQDGASVAMDQTVVEDAPAQQTQGAAASGGASAPAPAPEQPSANVVNVTVSIDSSAVGNPVSGSGSFSLPQGSTVYDALCCLATPNGGPNYVRAIEGLAEFDYGRQSGWKYSVNGADPAQSCGSYVLSDGDVVVWRYVTSING